MKEIDEKDIPERDELVGDPLDLMTKAIKVHTEGIDLNEDVTLSNLDNQLSRYAKYVMEQVSIIGVLRGFLKSDVKIIKYSNYLKEWGKPSEVLNPEKKHFSKCRNILLNKVNSILLLSRSVKGQPLKAFLTYGKQIPEKDEEKLGILARLTGKTKKREDEYG